MYDLVCGCAAPMGAFLIREQSLGAQASPSLVLAYVATSTLVSAACIAAFDLRGIVSRFFSARDLMRVCEAALVSVLVSTTVLFIAFRLDTIPRSVPLLHAVLLVALLVIGRLMARYRRRQKDLGVQLAGSNRHTHTLIVGANSLTRAFIDMVREVANPHEVVVGILAPSTRLHGRRIAGYPVLGHPEKLPAIVAEYETHGLRIERVVVTDETFEPGSAGWVAIRDSAQRFAFDLEYLPHVLVPFFQHMDAAPDEPPGGPTAAPDERRVYWRLRRFVDVVGAASLLVLTLPLMGLIAFAVLVELGYPTIFWQQRLGRRKRPIHVFKFRTMRSPFDRDGQPHEGRPMGAVGRFLRATRLDELPQLYNILMGDMSFIGPRPLLPIDQPADMEARLAVRPGLTGLAQVQGGRHLSPEDKARLDAWYIDNASLALDLRILLATVTVVLRGDVAPDVATSLPVEPSATTITKETDPICAPPRA